jgi:hypothetical protein
MLEFTRRNIVTLFFFAEAVQFRTNFFVACFLANPIWCSFAVVNNFRDQTHYNPYCEGEDNPKEFLTKILLYTPLYFSTIVAVYFQHINELRLFVWSENNNKQQQTMLEIFERQQEGVILLKQTPKGGASDKPEVLYNNGAFLDIVKSKDVA